jgi:hypothetical protein
MKSAARSSQKEQIFLACTCYLLFGYLRGKVDAPDVFTGFYDSGAFAC